MTDQPDYRVIVVHPDRGAQETSMSGYWAETLADQLFTKTVTEARDGILFAVILDAHGQIRAEWPKRPETLNA
jgi:hypothetical protein